MLRRLLLLCALALFVSEFAYGLGLGELELESALNQEFKAEIELTNVRGLEPSEIRPGLASQEDFQRIGLDRNYLLTDLRFNVVTNDDGELAVEVTSTRPIVEPYLNFLVELLWPSGRILKEFTVLLDPPAFSAQGVAPIRPPDSRGAGASTASSAPQEQRSTAPQRTRQPSPAATTSSRNRLEQGSRSGDEYGMTGAGDTLWAIALETRPDDSISVQQMMLALQRANPDAFIDGNINLLKAGHVLRIPDAAEINRETFESAVRQVEQQNTAFEAYRGGRQTAQLDATPRQQSSGSGSEGASDGELRLLAANQQNDQRTSGNASSSAADAASAGEVQRLENELSVAEEDLDRARRASAELNTKVADLEAQIETLNDLVKLKDEQLAALQREVQRIQNEQESRPATPPPATASTGGLLSNPIVLGGLALVLILLVAGGMIWWRRRQESEDIDEDEELAVAAALDDEAEAGADEIDDTEPVIALAEEEEDVSPQTSDALSEADIYIAYGRFPQAITFLQNAIEAEPDRADLQLKLLEVYVQTEDATAFNLQLERLKALGDEDATQQALDLQRQIPGAAESAAAAMDATIVSSEPIEAIEEPADDDDDLSFDLDDLDSETEDDSLDLSDDLELEEDTSEAVATADDDEADFDLDLDLAADSADDDDELDLDLTVDSTDDDDELGLDLDLDEDEETEAGEATAATASPGETDLDDLDLDLDEDDDSDEGAISLEASDLDDMDLDAELEKAASDGDEELDLGDLDDDDSFELSLDDDGDDEITLDLDEAAEELNLDGEDSDDEFELNLDAEDSDDEFKLDLDDSDDDDEFDLDLGSEGETDEIELDLGDDDDDSLDLGLDDSDDDLELNLDEDASTKLDLARAYIDMGDDEGARGVLQDVLKEGDESEVQQANELLQKIQTTQID